MVLDMNGCRLRRLYCRPPRRRTTQALEMVVVGVSIVIGPVVLDMGFRAVLSCQPFHLELVEVCRKCGS